MAKPIGTWNKGRENANKGKTLPAEPLTEREVKELIWSCSRKAPTGIRNAALIAILSGAGLRISEALELMPKDLNEAEGAIRVLHGKGDKARIVGLDKITWGYVQRWLDRRKELGLNGRQSVFCTLKGEALESAYVRNLLPRLAKKAGIEKRVHPHGLRHTMACELLQEGIDIGIISKQLGHSSIATTARYLDHISPTKVVTTMQGRVRDI